MKVWKWLDGKKTTIAALAGPVLTWLLATDKIDGDTATMFAGVLTVWAGVAVGHKGVKRVKAKK